MKKSILLITLLAAFSPIVKAQTTNEGVAPASYTDEGDDFRKLRFGAYVAPTISWMRPSAAKNGSQMQSNGGSKAGLVYGLMADYNFTENYALATGLQVNSTGGIINTEDASITAGVSKSHFNYSLQFVEIPLALKLKTDRINKFTFFGQAGLTMAINISKKATYELTEKRSSGADTVYKADAKEKISGGVGNIIPVLFQMNVGIGAQYAIGPKLDAYVGIFFNNGFAPNVTDPTKYKGLPAFSDGNTRLNNFALRLGFYF